MEPTSAALANAQFYGLAVATVLAAWVVADAMRRGKRSSYALLYGFGVLLALVIFLPVYLFFRWQESKSPQGLGIKPNSFASANQTNDSQKKICRCCKKELEGDPPFCTHCGAQLKSATEIHANLK